ncbi:MAG: hypothetical protein ACR2NZ_01580 [Rubripirellula sp.]
MYKRANRLSLAFMLAASSLAGSGTTLWSQTPAQTRAAGWTQPTGQMRPVPREGFHTPAARPVANPQHQGWDLRWRRSQNAPQVAVQAQVKPSQTFADNQNDGHAQSQAAPQVASQRAYTAERVQPTAARVIDSGRLQVANHAPELRPVSGVTAPGGVAQTAWLAHPQRTDLLENSDESGGLTAPANTNYFQDPFGDRETALVPPSSISPTAVAQGEMQIPAPGNFSNENSTGTFAVPNTLESRNDLRTTVAQIELPPPSPEQAPQFTPPTVPSSPAEAQIKPWAEPEITPAEPSDSGLQFAPPATATPSQVTPPAAAPSLPTPVPAAAAPSDPVVAPPVEPHSLAPAPSAQSVPQSANELRTPPSSSDGTSLGEMMRQRSPDDGKPKAPAQPDSPPIIPGSPFDSPFDNMNEDVRDRDRLNSGEASQSGRYGSKEDVRKRDTFSCEIFRQRIAEQTIDQVSLDISPPYRPDEMDDSRYETLKSKFDEKQTIRTWRNRSGEPIASGRLRDLAYEQAVIETDNGQKSTLPINRLSEGDIAYIAENWGLPKECLIEQVAFSPRTWTPMTMTWKASNLCHNPLYFEDVNLERYGHTHGPLFEPVVQSAHFFANIAVLPYKMGVHCPNECQYALGYYRPGNCAPWITPPVPISARGAISQAATMTGLFWLIP